MITAGSKIEISNVPNSEDMWEAIGGNHDTFSQILYEFIDNSTSNITGNKSKAKDIRIEITDHGTHKSIRVEDTGTGIKNLDTAFTLGCKDGGETTLNEHGIGLKHALSSANPGNDSWTICTRTAEDRSIGVYKKIMAKYTFEDFKADVCGDEWPGYYNKTGTIIEFICDNELFGTIARGRQGGIKLFETLIEALIEDIGYTYAGLIKEGKIIITVISIDINGNDNENVVTPVEPVLEEIYELGETTETCDLGGGAVKLEYIFGRISDKSGGRYYKKKMSSSGCEIRVNGRILAKYQYKEVWGIETHPSYNGLHISVNIVSDNIDALPKTRTSKNGFREGDKKLSRVYEEILKKMPTPIKGGDDVRPERRLFTALAESKRTHMLGTPVITEEQHAYKSLGGGSVKMDLYIASLPDVIIYEGKKAKSTPKDVYQLMMYWDGLVYDGISPTQAILLAAEHPESVLKLIRHTRSRCDTNGTNYNFSVRTWKDEGLEHLIQNGSVILEDGD